MKTAHLAPVSPLVPPVEFKWCDTTEAPNGKMSLELRTKGEIL